MDFSVKDIQMGIKNVHNGNAVLGIFNQYIYMGYIYNQSRIHRPDGRGLSLLRHLLLRRVES